MYNLQKQNTMTQFDYDSQRAQINQRNREQRYNVRAEWTRRHNAILDRLNNAKADYNKDLAETSAKLTEILTHRNELRRNGFQQCAPQMEASFNAERQVEAIRRAARNYLVNVKNETKREMQALTLWEQEQFYTIAKEYEDAKLKLDRQREKDQLFNTVNTVEP